jgi:hypothetical protein
LKNLDGLENLTAVDGLTIYGNQSLETLSALKDINLQYLTIGNNDALKTLDGPHKITFTLGLLYSMISIADNDSLVDLNALNGIKRISAIMIRGNDSLTTLQDLNNLESLFSLEITDNDALTTLQGLNNIETLWYLDITDNDALENLDALVNLKSITNYARQNCLLSIRDNDALNNIDGLHNLTRIDGKVIISGNSSLQHIDGLVGIQAIEGLLDICYNPVLTNLNGLKNLKYVERYLNIGEAELYWDVSIHDNALLPSALAHALVDQLILFFGKVEIYNNQD